MGDWLDGEWTQKSPFCSCRVSVSAFSPHTINKDTPWRWKIQNTHTQKYTHTSCSKLQSYIVFFPWRVQLQLASTQMDSRSLVESSCWNARNLTWDLFTKHISFPCTQHALSIPRLKEAREKTQRENVIPYSADKWPCSLFAHYWVICISYATAKINTHQRRNGIRVYKENVTPAEMNNEMHALYPYIPVFQANGIN